MRQLDLFGFFEEEVKPAPVKAPPAPVVEKQPEPEPVPVPPPPVAEIVEAAHVVASVVVASDEQEDEVIEISHNLFSHTEAALPPVAPKKAATKVPGKRGRKSFKDIDAEINLVEVPDDDVLFQKLYYSISEVAKWFNVNTSLLRFWENEFDILKPRKNRKGDRLFRPEDVKNLQVIHHLLRQRKFSIEGAKKYIKQNKSKAEVNIQLIQSLTKFRSFLLEMKANLGA
jgi:DNA-binding transcriptional MerR regulator